MADDRRVSVGNNRLSTQRKSVASVEGGQEEDYVALTEEELVQELPIKQRGCTDIPFLILFMLYLAGMMVITVLGFKNGDPARLVFGTDYQGVQCGGDIYPTLKKITYPRVEEDILMSGFFTKIQGSIESIGDISFFGVCVEHCPLAGDFVCTNDAQVRLETYPVAERETLLQQCTNGPCSDSDVKKGCFQMLFDTTEIFLRCMPKYVYEVEELPESGCTKFKNITDASGKMTSYCVKYKQVTKVTKEQPTGSNILFDSFNTYAVWVENYASDIAKSWDVVLISGGAVTVGIGFMYIISLWCCVGLVVWASVIGSVVCSVAITLFCYVKAGIITSSDISNFINQAVGTYNDAADAAENLLGLNTTSATLSNVTSSELSIAESSRYLQEYTYAAYGFTIFTALLFFLVIALFSRIIRAIQIFAEASRAIRANVFLITLPIMSTAIMVGVIALWLYSISYVASMGKLEVTYLNTTFSVDPDQDLYTIEKLGKFSYNTAFCLFMFFGLLWILSFLNGVSVMVIAGVVVEWYFGGSSNESIAVSKPFPVIRSFSRTCRYHLGTIAFGSFLIALLTFIRYIAAYIQRKMSSAEKGNKALHYLLCLFQCFLRCVQKAVEFISKNGYIMCTIYGKNFCGSTRMAFVTIAENIAQVAMVTFLGDVIQRFGQILITILAGFSCWIYIDNSPQYGFGGDLQLNSQMFPVLVTMLLSWFISAEILSVYDITVDTLLISFCQDQRLSKQVSGHEKKSSPQMREFIGTNELKDKKLIRSASSFTMN